MPCLIGTGRISVSSIGSSRLDLARQDTKIIHRFFQTGPPAWPLNLYSETLIRENRQLKVRMSRTHPPISLSPLPPAFQREKTDSTWRILFAVLIICSCNCSSGAPRTQGKVWKFLNYFPLKSGRGIIYTKNKTKQNKNKTATSDEGIDETRVCNDWLLLLLLFLLVNIM